MEAETLALLAGAMVARRLDVHRPVIFSDCKTVVRTATRHLNLERSQGWRDKLSRLFRLSGEHRAFRHIYGALHGVQGALAWQPREQNREADLASCIGSRVGNMGILLSSAKNQNHALNDVLSLAIREELNVEEPGDKRRGVVHRRYRGGTRTVSLTSKDAMASRSFHREAKLLIANISAEVA